MRTGSCAIPEPVGRGASADVFAWRDGTVVKLYHPRWADTLPQEFERARIVHALGAPCPAVLERIEHDGRHGIVFDRIDGPLLLDGLRDGSATNAGVAARLADLHAKLHALRVPADSGLPRLREWLGGYLSTLPDAERRPAEAELARISDDPGLCHMDLHPGNVIVRGSELIVVDWINACSGPLALDVGRSFVLMAWQGATRRDGARQTGRLELAAHYRAAMEQHAAEVDVERAVGFAAGALLRSEPANPFEAELHAAIPWR